MRALAVLASILVGLAGPALARDQVPAETRDLPWHGVLPACTDPFVLAKVTTHFAQKEAEYWNSALTIAGYQHVQPIAYRPWGLDYIPRRFCEAKAYMSDGQWRTVYYSIREDLGTIGIKWGVEFCVVGLDRNWAYAPYCKMAQP